MVGLFGTLAFENQLKKTVYLQEEGGEKNPYFFAIVPDKVNVSYLRRKLVSLPGVEAVSLLEGEKITTHVRSVLESTQVSFDGGLLDLKYSGLKVGLSPDLKPRSLSLIRNYLTRLIGEKDVTLGAVKKPIQEEKVNPLKVKAARLIQWSPYFFLCLYILSLFMMRGNLIRESFLIETYQRKSKVFEKSLSYAQAPAIMGLMSFSLLTGGKTVFLLIILSASLGLLVTLGKRGEVRL